MRRKISLKEYLSNEINVRIWREIEKEATWKALFKQKPFFDQLHKEFDFFTEHAHSYGEITKHFTKYNINSDKQKKYVFLFFLLVFIEHHYYEVDLNSGVTEESYLFIKDLCEKTLEEFHTVKTDTASERIAEKFEALEDYNKLRHNEITIEIYEKQNQLIDKFQETKTLSKEDIESGIYPNFTERQQIKINPAIPNDPKDAFQLFKNYYAEFQFLNHKSIYFDRYRSFENENGLKAEIEILEKFIQKAQLISYTDACSYVHNTDDFHEYKRLTAGFYNDFLMSWEQHNLNSQAAYVYGRYVLLYSDLKDLLALHNTLKSNVPFIGDLLHNLNLSENILDYYYRLVNQPNSWDEVDKHFVGKLGRYNEPYQLCIYGAYVNMKDWEWVKMKIDNQYPPFDKVSANEIEEAKKQYALGFKYGYSNFEKDKIENEIFREGEIKPQKVFDFATGRMFKSSGFSESFGNGIDILSGWKDAGVLGGYIYRAWYLMLENHSLFVPLFENFKIVNTKTSKNENNALEGKNITISKSSYLKDELIKYGFFELEKTKALSEINAELLFQKIINNKLPYVIAMFDYLGFIRHLSSEFFKSSIDIDKQISGWFKSDKDGRAVRGNRNALSKANSRYTSHNHKQNVEKDYNELK